MAAWKRATRIDRNCCEGIRKIRFTFRLNKYQQDKKYDTCWQIASRFQFLIILSERESLQWQPALQVAGWRPVIWYSGRQNWIFGRIGDQEGAISDPVNSHRCCTWQSMDIVRRKLMLVTIGTWRVKWHCYVVDHWNLVNIPTVDRDGFFSLKHCVIDFSFSTSCLKYYCCFS